MSTWSTWKRWLTQQEVSLAKLIHIQENNKNFTWESHKICIWVNINICIWENNKVYIWEENKIGIWENKKFCIPNFIPFIFALIFLLLEISMQTKRINWKILLPDKSKNEIQ